jgi:hypothetical protein
LSVERCEVDGRVILTTLNHLVTLQRVSIRHCQLTRGLSAVVAAQEVDLTGTSLGATSSISAAEAPGVMPRLVSLSAASVDGLRVTGLDLSACRLRDAQGLSGVMFRDCDWLRSPGLVRRRIVLEELLWRQAWPVRRIGRFEVRRRFAVPHRSRAFIAVLPPRRWGSLPIRDADSRSSRVAPSAWSVEATYSDLRRGASSAGNAALAADYAWGELTMRRLAGVERKDSRSALPWILAALLIALRGIPRRALAGRMGFAVIAVLLRCPRWVRSAVSRWFLRHAAPPVARSKRRGKGDRSLMRLYRIFGGYGLRAGTSILLATSGFTPNGPFCDLGACWRSPGSAAQPTVATAPRAVSTTFGLLSNTTRPETGALEGWVPGVIAVSRFLFVGLLAAAAFALRSRMRR